MATASATSEAGARSLPHSDTSRLRLLNAVIGLVHLAQGIAMLILSNDFSLPVTRTFLTGPPGTMPEQEAWFDVLLGPAVAVFLFLAAIDHLLMAAPGVNRWYNGMLANERNDARWIEYSVSASLMIVLIAMITGVTDIGALIAIAGVNACMIFFGLVQDRGFILNGKKYNARFRGFAFRHAVKIASGRHKVRTKEQFMAECKEQWGDDLEMEGWVPE